MDTNQEKVTYSDLDSCCGNCVWLRLKPYSVPTAYVWREFKQLSLQPESIIAICCLRKLGIPMVIRSVPCGAKKPLHSATALFNHITKITLKA